MTGMTSKGVHQRAVELRGAANRLRWEADLALGEWPTIHQPTLSDALDVASALRNEIAETVGILRVILDTVERELPMADRTNIITGDLHQAFAERVAYYHGYHQVGR